MRRKDITENPFKKFQQSVARGFTATQSGGALAPDAAEKGIKNFFTNYEKPDKEKKSKDDSKNTKGGAGTDDAMKTAKADAEKAAGDAGGALATMAAKRKYSKELAGYTKTKADSKPPAEARLVGNDGRLYHWSGSKWLVRNDTNGRYEPAEDQEAVKAGWIDAAPKGKRTYIKKESTMNKKAIEEGLADLASRAEADHEVQMARADLYKIAKYAIKLHDMLKGVSEAEGLEGWQQAKITKASDYISSVYHNLDYDMKFGEAVTESKSCNCDENCPCGGNCGPNCNCHPGCGISEGKSPHKKGSAKYKKHMAAKHASMNEDEYKASIAERLNKKLSGK